MYLDSSEPGHLKIMVYLTPFDNEHGYFKFENKIVNNKPAGFSLMFKNSDLIHSGVPGELRGQGSARGHDYESFG